MGKKILSAGLIVQDIIVTPVSADVFEKDAVYIDRPLYCSGGDALNSAAVLAKLGADVSFTGMIGKDMAGSFLLDEMKKRGIASDRVIQSDRYGTSTSIVLGTAGGERHFAYYGDSNNNFAPDMITDNMLESIDILYIASVMTLTKFTGEALEELFVRAKKHNVITAMDSADDPEGLWLKRLTGALKYTDVFIPSYIEAEKITGKNTQEDMTDFLLKRGVKIAGVKNGANGVFVSDGTKSYNVPAFSCENAVDTTGAGDAFMGGFLYGISKGWSTYSCAVFGSAVANFTVRKAGAVTNAPSYEETVRFIKDEIAVGRYRTLEKLDF